MKKIVYILTIVFLSFLNGNTQERINFIEDEDFEVSDLYLKELKLDKLVIAAGEYYIDFNQDNPYGFVVLNIKDVVGEVDTKTQYLRPGIRIAKRKHRSCPRSTCACGIGFRCGFTNLTYEGEDDGNDEGGDDERTAYVSYNIDKEKSIITLYFSKPIDWSKINN